MCLISSLRRRSNEFLFKKQWFSKLFASQICQSDMLATQWRYLATYAIQPAQPAQPQADPTSPASPVGQASPPSQHPAQPAPPAQPAQPASLCSPGMQPIHSIQIAQPSQPTCVTTSQPVFQPDSQPVGVEHRWENNREEDARKRLDRNREEMI